MNRPLNPKASNSDFLSVNGSPVEGKRTFPRLIARVLSPYPRLTGGAGWRLVLSFCAILSVSLCATETMADNIEILSRQFTLSGGWSDGDASGTYGLSSSGDPIAISLSTPFGGAHVSAGIADFSLYNDAYGGPTQGTIGTRASADWQIHPLVCSRMTVDLAVEYRYNYYSYEQSLNVSLTDVTSGTALLNLSRGDFQNGYGEQHFAFDFDLDPGHIYDFGISGWSANFLSKDTTEHVRATLSALAVPDTMSCGWMLSPILIGMLLIRRALKLCNEIE